jgi:avermectin B 5-O-methyltransferase
MGYLKQNMDTVQAGPETSGRHAARFFYFAMRLAYDKVYGEQQMLHYPIYKSGNQDLLEGQRNFTDHCVGRLGPLAGRRMLEIGCGNGVQSLYVHETYRPAHLLGIDINESNIRLALEGKRKRGAEGIDFAVDNAQVLAKVEDASIDAAICTESAHHYPDKQAFLRQVHRVLKPGGLLALADLLRKDGREPNAVERQLMLFHWSREKYGEALAAAKLTVVEEEDLNELILPAFEDARAWFPGAGEKGKAPSRLGMLFGKALIGVYKSQLEHTLRYQLMLIRKD